MNEVIPASRESWDRLYDNMKRTAEDVYKQQYVVMVLNEALGKDVFDSVFNQDKDNMRYLKDFAAFVRKTNPTAFNYRKNWTRNPLFLAFS